ncbi:MAG: hypothetical protein M1365_09250 [Actinobacteria bacterium]|nr:hypothetical protein [Actinomycetota bacterium]
MSIVFMAGAITVAALSIYKNYLRGIVKETYIYFIVFILLMLITSKQYPLILLLVLPVIPLFIIAIIRGKKMQIPINRFQFGYFLYAVFILLIVTTFNLI